jgi:hypothetical protein
MKDVKALYTYGDQLRRKGGGPVKTILDVGANAYYFTDGTFALVADQDCYSLVRKASGYFRVASSMDGMPLDDHLHHGYEFREDFAAAIRRLLHYWGGRVGENVAERNKFLHLRFHDTPGGKPDEAWIPLYMLTPADKPAYIREKPETEPFELELDSAFGFLA